MVVLPAGCGINGSLESVRNAVSPNGNLKNIQPRFLGEDGDLFSQIKKKLINPENRRGDEDGNNIDKNGRWSVP